MFNSILSRFSLMTLALAFTLLSPSVSAITVTAGLVDNFLGGPDPANPSPELATLLITTANFDELNSDANVGHTFADLPGNIVSATLEIHLKANNVPGVETDGIFISFVDDTTTALVDDIVWKRTFGDYAGGGTVFDVADPGLLTPGVSWAAGNEYTFTLDLSALPEIDGSTVNILALINENGFFDITVGDETMVDYFRLTYSAVPVPAAVWLFGSGLLGLIGTARRKRTATA